MKRLAKCMRTYGSVLPKPRWIAFSGAPVFAESTRRWYIARNKCLTSKLFLRSLTSLSSRQIRNRLLTRAAPNRVIEANTLLSRDRKGAVLATGRYRACWRGKNP